MKNFIISTYIQTWFESISYDVVDLIIYCYGCYVLGVGIFVPVNHTEDEFSDGEEKVSITDDASTAVLKDNNLYNKYDYYLR